MHGIGNRQRGRRLRRLGLGLALATSPLAPAPLAAQASVPPRGPFFTEADLWLAGGATLGALALAPFDGRLADAARSERVRSSVRTRRTANAMREWGFPGTVVVAAALFAGGRLGGNERMARLGLRAGQALAVANTVGTAGKFLAGRARPSQGHERSDEFGFLRGFAGGEWRSMPSGHSIAAFAAASALTSEIGRWSDGGRVAMGAATYTAAALTGLSRMYHDRHWATDVVAGAAIGTLAGRTLVRFQAAHPSNTFDDLLLSASLSPTAGGAWAVRWMIVPGVRWR